MTRDVAGSGGEPVRLSADKVVGTAAQLTLRPPSVFRALRPGGEVSIDFDGALLRVTKVGDGWATAVVTIGGQVKSNRAVNIEPAPSLPALTNKDRRALEIGVRCGIEHFALSFAGSAADVALLRNLVPPRSHILAQIQGRARGANPGDIIQGAGP